MERLTDAEVLAAIVRLNGLYGRGDVIGIDRADSTFTRIPFGCRAEIRRMRVVGRQVFACGFSMVVKE